MTATNRRELLAVIAAGAAALALPSLPAQAQPSRDTTLRWVPFPEMRVRLGGADYNGLVPKRDYDPETIDTPPRGAGSFGQGPYIDPEDPEAVYRHSEDYGLVTMALPSYHTRERRWVDQCGGAYIKLVDAGDQGTPVLLRMTSVHRDGKRRAVDIEAGRGFTVRNNWVVIPGGAQSRLNRNITTCRYEGFMREARLEIQTGPGVCPPPGAIDPGARCRGDGFLFAMAGRVDCIDQETNRMVVRRRLAAA
jgi:hypothetical protein